METRTKTRRSRRERTPNTPFEDNIRHFSLNGQVYPFRLKTGAATPHYKCIACGIDIANDDERIAAHITFHQAAQEVGWEGPIDDTAL